MTVHEHCKICDRERSWHDLRRCEGGAVCLDCVPRTIDSAWLPYLLAGIDYAIRLCSPRREVAK